MKKLKIVGIILVVLLSLATVFVITARYFIIKHLSQNATVNRIVEQTSQVVNDAETKKQIDDMIQKLIDDGVINEEQLKKYSAKDDSSNSDNSTSKDSDDEAYNNRKKERLEKQIGETDESDSSKEQSRTEKILSAMSPSDASFAMSIYEKIDANYAMSLMKTDKAAAKQYITERLSSDEISRALGLYSKYSDLLK